jgi:hypothetical protein
VSVVFDTLQESRVVTSRRRVQLAVKEQVLILRKRSPRARTHALDCNWANGRHKLDYVQVDVKDLPPDQPRCSHCGGR